MLGRRAHPDGVANGDDKNDENDEPSADNATPSLLRIGLSAGFVSLSQKSGKQRPNGSVGASSAGRKIRSVDFEATNDDDGIGKKSSLLSSPNEEAETLSCIEGAQDMARGIGSSQFIQGMLKNLANDHPTTLAALSALGDHSHSSKGVLVNVIDPTSNNGSGTNSQNNSGTMPAMPDTPPPAGVGGGAKGLFSSFSNSSGGGNSSHSANNSNHADSVGGSPSTDMSSLHIYTKLRTTFSQNYNSTLHSLPYIHPRTSTRHQLPALPVRFGLTTQPVMDPANWHDGPYCHVYIAAVENMEHYRSKIRPALRAFVNQIEGSGTTASTPGAPAMSKALSGAGGPGGVGASPSMGVGKGKKSANEKALARAGLAVGKTSVAGNFGSRYVIVFIPIPVGGGGSSSSGMANAGKLTSGGAAPGSGGFGGFRGRKGQSGGVVLSAGAGDGPENGGSAATTAASSSASDSTGGARGAQHHGAAAAAALPPGPIAHSSREVKELYHKFIKDFPNGRTVILGTLTDATTSVSPLKNQEWKAFLHNLGAAVVDGFQDRVRRYDEELRRLDSKRAAFVRKLSGDASSRGANGNAGADGNNFDLSHFFLVKESLAFTYEQMQLFEEAKLQYEELSAFLPEDAWRQLAQRGFSDEFGKDGGAKDDSKLADLAMAGDSDGFRYYIKTAGRDLRGVSQHVPQYMYAREIRLLFQMGTSTEVLVCSKNFLVRGYRNRLMDVAAEFRRRWKEDIEGAAVDCPSSEILKRQDELRMERLRMEAEVEAWALSSCWDVKCASEQYFTFETVATENGNEGGGKLRDRDNGALTAASTVEEVEAARCLAELIEFAILRLMRLGDLALMEQGGALNPIRRATSERPADTLKPWEPWRNLQKIRDEIKMQRLQKDEEKETWTSILPSGVSSWIHNAVKNASVYEETYLELAEAAVILNRRAGRFRFASRLEDHRAEVLIARTEYDAAAHVLSDNVGACARDQWTRAHYWRIFRLACCQRMSGDVLAYLETLTQSFNPKLSSVAPQKTASLFQKDLEAIITDAAVAEPRWGAFPFLETELSIESEAAGKSSQPLPFLRRKLTKHLCFVGDELRFSLSINSHLPRPIAVNGVRLYLVTIEQYERVYRRNGIVAEDDAFRILTIDAPIDIMPGQNDFSFSWQPMTSNTYVLATVEIQWKEASFFYDSALLRKPMIGLDIQPSEPTQTIELNPLFLIPGHVQNVRLVFHSGSDVITEGLVRLICSEGLLVVPPKTDPSKLDEAWSDECIIPLDACGPGKKVVITTLVKSSTIKHDDTSGNIQTMRAKVETRYRQESYDAVMAKGEEPESDPMKTLLQAMVTTLDRPALAVDAAEAFLFGDEQVMVNISLQCNSPVPFYIKEWHLDLPPPLLVEQDGDLNKDMFHHAIPEGEMLLFGFKCMRTDSLDDEHRCERPLLRVVLQDDFGKTFLQVLPVNLEDIYKKLRKEDVYAELYTATAELTCSTEEGTVGHPVPFVYDLNLQSLMTPRQRRRSSGASVSSVCGSSLLYTIVSDGSDWIVSGKVQGLIKPSEGSESISLHFRGIPTQSGILRNFPELFLEYLPTKDSDDSDQEFSPPISVQCKNPDCFQSFAYTTSLSLAVPAVLEEF